MTDPPRLRDLPDGDAWTRQLLRDAPKSSALTPADYARLGARVPQTLAGASTVAATALPLKALALLGAISLGAAGAVALRQHPPSTPAARSVTAPPSHPPPPVAEPTPPPTLPPMPVASDPAARPDPAATVTPAPIRAIAVRPPPQRARVVARPAPAQTTPTAPPEPTLAQELQVLDAARAQMRTDPAGAAALLRDATGTQLRDERDALRAESLARAGRLDEARVVARALTARAPHSPQSARVRSLLGESP